MLLGGIFHFIHILIKHSVANNGNRDQKARSVPSGLGLYCLRVSQRTPGLYRLTHFYYSVVGLIFVSVMMIATAYDVIVIRWIKHKQAKFQGYSVSFPKQT